MGSAKQSEDDGWDEFVMRTKDLSPEQHRIIDQGRKIIQLETALDIAFKFILRCPDSVRKQEVLRDIVGLRESAKH